MYDAPFMFEENVRSDEAREKKRKGERTRIGFANILREREKYFVYM